jgi:hypothetical protein
MQENNLISTENGGIEISRIVRNKTKIKVWVYNKKLGTFKTELINEHFIFGKFNRSEMRHLLTTSYGTGGRLGLTVLLEQRILTKDGWKKTGDLKIGDKLISKYDSIINNSLKDFLFGTFCGDCTLASPHKSTANMRFQDTNNPEYLEWKVKKLSPFFNFKKCGDRYDSDFSYELFKLKQIFRGNERNPIYMLNEYSDLSMAIWFMDDGSYDCSKGHSRYMVSVKRLKSKKWLLKQIHNKLDELGFPNRFNTKDGSFSFDKSTTNKIASKICSYIPTSMQYKLPDEFKGLYKDFSLKSELKIKPFFVTVLKNGKISAKRMRNRNLYGISVSNSNNFLAGGIKNGVVVEATSKKPKTYFKSL